MWRIISVSAGNGDGRRRARRRGRRRCRAAVAITALVAALVGTSLTGAPSASASATETVIVTSSGLVSAVTAVLSVGGSILTQFHLINAVDATIPAITEPLLASLPGISVTPDAPVTVQATPESIGPHTPSDVFRQETGADQLAAAGDTGQGVTVAVMDTGIDKLPDFAGRLLGGVDLSGEGNPYQDSYGHGTFVAGLIAGDGASSGGQDSGEAPGANLVSIKVAGASGVTHVSTLMAGLQWAVDNENRYGIKVLNLSLGFQSSQPTQLDALDIAAEAAWNAGIAVVVAAGNSGPFNGTILAPGDDPLVITVGALDDMATPAIGDDEMTNFSAVGPTSANGWAKPDLVASGRSVVSLAAPGSTIYNENPSARVGPANFVGSGTSFSAAITSGAIALVLADNPGLTPDEVKARLLGNTDPGPVGNPFVDGHGALNAYAAATSNAMNLSQSSAGLVPVLSSILTSLLPTGPVDTWNLSLWTGLSAGPPASGGPAWNGLAWNGDDWNGLVWTGRAWNDGGWAGAQWNAAAWTGRAWNDAAWEGSAWAGVAWNAGGWAGSAWS
jgi:serine protease AprX